LALAVLFTSAGTAVAFIGLCVVLFYWIMYDTSVPSVSYGVRVHNIGLMQNRQIGIMIGLGILLVGFVSFVFGAALFFVGRRRTEDSA
jgi:hypothetical protein